MGPSSMGAMTGHGISGDAYPTYGYPYDQSYPPNGFPPHPQPPFPPRAASMDMGRIAYQPQPSLQEFMSSNSRARFPPKAAGASSHGVDLNPPGLSSDWPQNSTSSHGPLVAYAGLERYRPTSPVATISGPSPINQALPHVSNPDGWQKPISTDSQDLWSTFFPPPSIQGQAPQNEDIMNAINSGVHGPVHDHGSTSFFFSSFETEYFVPSRVVSF